ncbi:MAG: hypothetical protein ACYS26_15190 [Planctomycetota bacterium]|jgi:hypothetical protein
MLPLRSASALALLALPAADAELRFAPAADAVLSSELTWNLEAECTASDIVAMGDDLPDDERPDALFQERMHLDAQSVLAVVDSAHRGAEANLGFERALASWTLNGDAAGFGPIEEGLSLRYSREGENDAYEVQAIDDEGAPLDSPAVLSAFAPGLAPHGWLGDLESLEEDATLEQELDGGDLLDWLTPALALEGLVDLGESFPAESFPALLVLDLEDALQSGETGQVIWTVQGRSNVDGAEVLTLSAEVVLDFEGDLTRAFFSLFEALVPGADPEESEMQADLTVAGELSGTLLWNLDGNHLHSAEWGGELEVDVTIEGDVSVDGFALPIEALFAWEGELSCSQEVSAR